MTSRSAPARAIGRLLPRKSSGPAPRQRPARRATSPQALEALATVVEPARPAPGRGLDGRGSWPHRKSAGHAGLGGPARCADGACRRRRPHQYLRDLDLRGQALQRPGGARPTGRHSERAGDVRRPARAKSASAWCPRTRRGLRIDSDDAAYEVPDFTSPRPTIATPLVFRGRTARDHPADPRRRQRGPDRGATVLADRTAAAAVRRLRPGGDHAGRSTLRLLNRMGDSLAALPAPTSDRLDVPSRGRPRAAAARRLPRRDRRDVRQRQRAPPARHSHHRDSTRPIAALELTPADRRRCGLQELPPAMHPARMLITPRRASRALCSAFTVFYSSLVEARAAFPPRRPKRSRASRPARRTGHRLRHQFLRHAWHRLVCADDGDLQVLQDGARPLDPRHVERRPHAADDHSGVHLHARPSRSTSPTLILMIRRRGRRRVARRGHRRQLAEAQDSDRAWAARSRRWRCCSPGAISEMTNRQPGHRRDGAGHARPAGLRSSLLGLVGNFVLGALMTLGIGMYAPCMILVGLLGMNAKAAFPIMMGSCAFLMPIAARSSCRSRPTRSGRRSASRSAAFPPCSSPRSS